MGMFEGCLIASDIDETLVVNGKIPKRNIEAIRFFTAEGGKFSLATGRLPSGAKIITDKLEFLSPSVFGNGAIAFNSDTGETLFEYLLDGDDFYAVQKAKRLYPDIGIVCFYRSDAYTVSNNARVKEHGDYEGINYEPIDFSRMKNLKIGKILYFCDDLAHSDALKGELCEFSKSSVFINSSFIINGVRRYMLEQIPKGVSKSAGVLKLAQKLNIKKGSVYTIGDYYNDLDMIKAADIGAATFGAPDEVKAVADVVVGKAENGAVADFIDYLISKEGKTK